MKRSILLLLAAFIAVTAFSQTSYYKGEWSRSGTTYVYASFLKLTITGTLAEGEIIWKFVSPDKMNKDNYEFMKGKVGLSAVEIFSGSYDPEARDLKISGLDKVDPHGVIGEDVYTLKISANRKIIFGKTDAGGSGSGCLYAILQNTAAAAIEYASLRNKIK